MSDEDKLRVVVVERPEDFDEAVAAHKSAPKLLVLFVGEADAATGKSWCSDCEAAEPFIHAATRDVDGVMLRCIVKRSEYRGNPDYAYRKHKKVKLTGVPTLMRWGRTGPVASLVEAQLLDASVIATLCE